jgi:hypothetical protein
MRGPLSVAADAYNYAEIGIWCAIGTVVAAVAFRRRGAVRRDCLIASAVLYVFGVSDYAEVRAGGEWWTPWWLLLWKASCVFVLLALLLRARRRARAPA